MGADRAGHPPGVETGRQQASSSKTAWRVPARTVWGGSSRVQRRGSTCGSERLGGYASANHPAFDQRGVLWHMQSSEPFAHIQKRPRAGPGAAGCSWGKKAIEFLCRRIHIQKPSRLLNVDQNNRIAGANKGLPLVTAACQSALRSAQRVERA